MATFDELEEQLVDDCVGCLGTRTVTVAKLQQGSIQPAPAATGRHQTMVGPSATVTAVRHGPYEVQVGPKNRNTRVYRYAVRAADLVYQGSAFTPDHNCTVTDDGVTMQVVRVDVDQSGHGVTLHAEES